MNIDLNPFLKELKEFGIKFEQTPDSFIQYSENIKCRGYFDHSYGTLKISSCDNWEHIFFHEFGHFIQYKRQTEIWRKCINNQSLLKLDNWINKICEYQEKEILEIINDVFLLEKECEEITLELLKEKNIYLEKYKENSDNYLNYYSSLYKTRTFNSINI